MERGGYAPSKRQTVAAVLMVVSVAFVQLWPLLVAYCMPEVTGQKGYVVQSALASLLELAAWGVLWRLVANKAVRVAVVLMMASLVLGVVSNVVSMSGIPGMDVICGSLSVLVVLACLYGLMLIAVNSRMDEATRSWIGLLGISSAFAFLHMLMHGFLPQERLWAVLTSVGDSLWHWLWLLLCAVGYWKLVRSEVFCGVYDAEQEPCYSPLNRWLALLIAPAVTLLLLCLLNALLPM